MTQRSLTVAPHKAAVVTRARLAAQAAPRVVAEGARVTGGAERAGAACSAALFTVAADASVHPERREAAAYRETR